MSTFTKKIFFLTLIFTILMAILMSIRVKVNDREREKNNVQTEISQSHSGLQNISPPIIVIKYKERINEEFYDSESKKTLSRKVWLAKKTFIFPDNLTVNSKLEVSNKKRGLYSVPVYLSHSTLDGDYQVSNIEINQDRVITDAYFMLGFTELKSLSRIPSITLNNKDEFKFNTASSSLANSEHLLVSDISNIKDLLNKKVNFALPLTLKGSMSFGLIPSANNTKFSINSNWQHPSFFGTLLPDTKDIGDAGFTSTWNTNKLSAVSTINCLLKENYCQTGDNLSVRLVETVDSYTKTDRITKYGFLFILLTFAAFLLFEVLKKLSIHGVQYGLVGLALLMFYLLLLSLSEHIGFNQSYIISASACITLISFYLKTVLHSTKAALVFGAMLSSVYACFFFILKSEDYALLMGSLLLFAALSAIMTLTRKIDWDDFQVINLKNKKEASTENSISSQL